MSGYRVVWLAFLGLAFVGFLGCDGTKPPAKPTAPPFQGIHLTVGVVGDPAILKTVDPLRGEWEASRGGTCTLQERPIEPTSTGKAHLILFRADELGALIDAEALAVLPESLVRPPVPTEEELEKGEKPIDAFQYSDVVLGYREQVTKYGRDRMAFPYGGSALVLVYRPEAFDRDENKKAAKTAGIELEPPTTWEQLDALAKFFQGRDWSGDGTPDYGIALALGLDPEGVGDATYLSRAASLGQHRDHYSLLFESDTMTPRLTSPPFVEALQKLVALESAGPPGMEGLDAETARKAFRKGDVALLIDRAERPATWSEGGAAVGLAVLPGSNRVYDPSRKIWEDLATPNRPSYLPYGGGWLVGVSSATAGHEREAAIDLAKYLVSPDTASRVRSDRAFPMLPVRSSHVGQGLPDPAGSPGVEPEAGPMPWAEPLRPFGSFQVYASRKPRAISPISPRDALPPQRVSPRKRRYSRLPTPGTLEPKHSASTARSGTIRRA